MFPIARSIVDIPAAHLASTAPPLARARRARRRAALHESVGAQHVDRLEFLSARVVYDEVQPQAKRAAGRTAGPGGSASLSRGEHVQGLLAILFDLQADPGGDCRLAGRQLAAGGRCPGRVDGPFGGGGLLPRSRRKTHPGVDPRQRRTAPIRLRPTSPGSRRSRSRATAGAWSTSPTSRPS